MTTDAGSGQDTAAAGNAAVNNQPGGNPAASPNEIPADVMPLVERLFDKRMAKKEQEWQARQEQARKDAEMTEAQKAQAQAAEAAKRLAETEARLTRYERREAVLSAVTGYVPAEFIDAALSSVSGDEFDAAAVAAKAREKWEAAIKASGVPIASAPSTAPKPTVPKTGGPPTASGSTDFAQWTVEQAAAHAQSLGPGKGLAWWNENVVPFQKRGGKFANEGVRT